MIDMKIKHMFFDRKAVINAVDKAKRAVISRSLAFIRTSSRSSIRKRKRSSPPGSPPSSHLGLLRKILFGYDKSTDSGVVGPLKLNKPGNTPQVTEEGGITVITRFLRGRRRKVRVRVDARPYMGPALKKEQPKLPSRWAGSVRG